MFLSQLFGRKHKTSASSARPAGRDRRRDYRPQLETLERRDTPSTVWAVNAAGNALVRFDSTATGALGTTVNVSGLSQGEVVEGIDFRTVTGQLYAVAVAGSTARVGTINLDTGVFTQVGGSFNLTGTKVDLDIDPVNDRLHVLSNTTLNLTVDPTTGVVTTDTNLSSGVDGLAFSQNFKGSAQTTAYGISTATDQLVIIGSLNGSPTGITSGNVSAVGSLGVDATAVAGFDIRSDGTAIATLTVSGTQGVYSIDLSTGAATLIGNIGAAVGSLSNLAIEGSSVYVAGSGPGAPASVKVYDASNASVTRTLSPFNGTFSGGVHVDAADVNRDGVADIIVGAAAGGGPHVQVFDGRTGALIHSFFAFDSSFTGGVSVAAGDVNGDGFADIIVGAGSGHSPEVKVFSGLDESVLLDFMAYDFTFTGGVNVAAGDVDLAGGLGTPFKAEIITGAGAGGGPHVKVFSSTGATLQSFFAYSPLFTGGVFVTAGDVNGDGKADIVTGAGANGGPHVRAFSGFDGTLLTEFMATDPSFSGGVRVGLADINMDGRLDFVTSFGQGMAPTLRLFNGTTLALSSTFNAFDPAFMGGVFVGGSAT